MPKKTKTPVEPVFDASENPSILDFCEGTRLLAYDPSYAPSGRLVARVEAWHGPNKLNASTLDLLDDRARQAFAEHCAQLNGHTPVDWLPRLLLLAHGVQETLDRHMPARLGAPPPMAFPVGVFPQNLQAYITQGAQALPCPADFLAVPTLAVLGAAIGTKCPLELKPGWQELAILWTAVIAETGSKKSPALGLAAAPIHTIQQILQQEYERGCENYENDLATYEDTRAARKSARGSERDRIVVPPKPTHPVYAQLYSTNATIEALMAALESNPTGLLFLQDELTGWARSMNQYRGGKGADRQCWLSFWNAAPVLINRKNKPAPLYVDKPFVAVTGVLPPAVLGDLADEAGREDGFVHRLLFAMPDPVPLGWSDTDIPEMLQDAYRNIVNKLRMLEPRTVHLTPEAKAVWVDWVNGHAQEMTQADFAPALRGPWAKMEGLCARIALTVHLTACVEQHTLVYDDPESGTPSPITVHDDVTEESMQRAIQVMHYFKNHARRVYRLWQASPEAQLREQAVAWIAKHGREASPRDLYHYHVAGCETAFQAARMLASLVEYGYGTWQEQPRQQGGYARKQFVLHAHL